MTNQEWLDFFQKLGRGLKEKVGRLAGTPEARKPLGKGAGGDITVYIDQVAEDFIISQLNQRAFKKFKGTLISEEVGEKIFGEEKLYLLVDPIDGSLNAKRGIPLFSASFALARGEKLGDIEVGLVINLVTGQEFWAKKGEGSFFNGTRLKVYPDRRREVLTYELPQPQKSSRRLLSVLSHYSKARNLGSLALDLCFFAQGASDAFIMPGPTRPLDFAAGLLIVQEAGGKVVDLTGKSLEAVSAKTRKVKGLIAAKDNREIMQLIKWMSPGPRARTKR